MPRQDGFFIWNKVSTFKKTNGQAALEYLVILGAVAGIVLISTTSPFRLSMAGIGEKFYSNAVEVFKATAFKK